MQVLNLDADLNISRLDADIRTLRLGEGGTTNYNDLTNKPSINSVTLTGNKTTSDLNIKTSELVNDAGFITNADIPTKTSDLINDDGFQTATQVSSAVAAAIPTNVSAFTNDAGYITAAQVGNIPTKTSDLTNDSGFITSAEAPVQSVNGYTGAVSLDGNNVEYSAGVSVNDKIDTVESSIPTKTSDLTNDSGFITSLNVPSKTSDLTNDSGFITSAEAPVQSVNGYTGAVTLEASDIEVSAGVTVADSLSDLASYIPQTATITDTAIASFSDGADNVPVSELIVDINAVQAGSGTPSPSNPRAISGHSTCTIKVNDDLIVPQTEKTTAISLGTTVYGGVLNVTTGVLTITHGHKLFTGDNSESWTNVLNGFNIVVSDAKQIQTPICNRFNAVSSRVIGNLNNLECAFAPSGALNLNFKYDDSPDLTSWKTWLSNNNVQVVYELATPTTIQLTPTEVRSLLGNNNIFADTGNINELVYFKTGCEALARLIEAYT